MAEENDECDDLLQDIIARQHSTTVASSLILNLNSYLKKPTIEVELSKVLATYLQHLQTSQIYLSNGVFNTNFAEGALLVQSAATLYAKKIDLLWDCMIGYQERMILYEERTETNENEFQAVNERKERFKRKKRKKEEPAPVAIEQPQLEDTSDLFNKVLESMRTDYSNRELMEMVIADESELHLEGNLRVNKYFYNWYSMNKPEKKVYPILMGDKENLYEEHENGSIYRKEVYPLTSNQLTLRHINCDGELEAICDYTDMVLTVLFDDQTADLLKLKVYITSPDSMKFKPKNIIECVMQMLLVHYNITINDLYEEPAKFNAYFKHFLRTLSPDAITKKLRAILMDTSQQTCADLERLPLEGATNNVPECNAYAEPVKAIGRFDPLRKTIESRSDIDSGFFDGEMDYRAGSSEIDKCLSSRTTPFPPVWETEVHVDSGINLSMESIESDLQKQPSVHNVTIEEQVIVRCRRIRKRKTDDSDDDDKPVLKRKRKPTLKVRPTTTASLNKFECFFSNNYTTGEGEGNIVALEYESESDDDNGASQLNISSTSVLNNIIESLTIICQEPEDEQDERLINYIAWREFINNKVGTQTECNFDIHDEGTHIIESIGAVGASIKYSSLCQGKTAREVSRSFIAMLQLANTNNVEITNVEPKKLANNTLEVKLLSTERHHENLCAYQAPSEMSFKDRMKKAKAASYETHMQPSTSSIHKKVRLR